MDVLSLVFTAYGYLPNIHNTRKANKVNFWHWNDIVYEGFWYSDFCGVMP